MYEQRTCFFLVLLSLASLSQEKCKQGVHQPLKLQPLASKSAALPQKMLPQCQIFSVLPNAMYSTWSNGLSSSLKHTEMSGTSLSTQGETELPGDKRTHFAMLTSPSTSVIYSNRHTDLRVGLLQIMAFQSVNTVFSVTYSVLILQLWWRWNCLHLQHFDTRVIK